MSGAFFVLLYGAKKAPGKIASMQSRSDRGAFFVLRYGAKKAPGQIAST